MERIPLADLQAQYSALKCDLDAAAGRVLASGRYVRGPERERFEGEFARALGVGFCVGVGNGTDALALALVAAGVGAGDAVLLPAHTFRATAEAVRLAGAQPVLADVDPQTLLLDAACAGRAWTDKVRAVMPVHLYGMPAPMGSLLALAAERDAVVIEDAAQAHGAMLGGDAAGSLGLAAGFSFFPGKLLGAAGDGGAVVTDDEALADRVRCLANHGRGMAAPPAWGRNSRLDELQAALLSIKLANLEAWVARRREIEAAYREAWADLDLRFIEPVSGSQPAPLNAVIRVSERDRLRAHLDGQGIDSAVHYPQPVHRLPEYADLGYAAGDFPVSEAAASEVLSLPNYPEMTESQVQRVIAAVKGFFG